MYDIITIGDALIDTHVHIDNAALECDLMKKNCQLCLNYGGKIPIVDSFQCLGGNAPNVSAGTAKLGLKTAIIGAVGNDSNGEVVVEKLKQYNIDTKFIQIDKQNQTRYSVVLNFKGERTILSYSQKKDYVWPKNLPETKWLYYTSLSQGFEKIHGDLKKYLTNHSQTKLALNPGSYMIKYATKYLRDAIKKCDLVIVNKEEAEKILNIKKSKSIVNLIIGLLKMGAKEVAITDGEHGAWAGDKKTIWKMKSFPVKPIAKTGAGDAFSSAYLAAKIMGKEIPQALNWGIANSCSVILEVGAQNGLLDKIGIEKLLKKYKNIQPIKI